MLNVEITPGKSIKAEDKWEIALGMGINCVIAILQKQFEKIKNIIVRYNLEDPFSSDIQLTLCNDGIGFDFDSKTQTLKLINLFDLRKVNVIYNNKYLNQNHVLTLKVAQEILGATKPLEYDSENKQYFLTFRGLALYFKADTEAENLPTQEPLDSSLTEDILYSTSFDALIGHSLAVFHGTNPAEPKDYPLPEEYYFNHCFLSSLTVLREDSRTKGIKLCIKSETHVGRPKLAKEVTILFGDSVESICTKLGSPNRIHYKEDNRMKIHDVLGIENQKKASDYFYNYFTLGLDLLIDGFSHSVIKFILHTNNIGSNDFSQYYQCPFKIPIPIVSELKRAEHFEYITPLSKWNTVKSYFGSQTLKPACLKNDCGFNNDCKYRITLAYGYQDMIFEVMKNNILSSVNLFMKPKI